jgi:class 3 adenylate cyclase/tetratricopeptide (TPR) repeat protein
MAAFVETLTSYVPALTLRRFAADPNPLGAPEQDCFPAALLFADISGFTALTERLAQHGPAGAEELSDLLNAYFEQMIALISAHGGDVVKFAGDALIALWTTDAADNLAAAALRTVQCSLAVQSALNEYDAAEGLRLALRVGIGAGEVVTMYVGGVNNRWELLIAGAPVDQMSGAEQQAHPGEVVLSPEAWMLVEDACVGASSGRGYVRVAGVERSLPLRAARLPVLGPEAEAALRVFVPSAVRSRLAAGQSDWLAELRRLTILFVGLPDLDDCAPRALEQTQRVIETLQRVLYRYEGDFNRLLVDEKGVTLVAALGLPPLAHEDDAVRGVQAAQAMQAELQALGMRCAIGVATGRVFWGAIGSEQRREYTMNGDVVVLAARLMQAASEDTLCDAATYRAAQFRQSFEALPSISVKGKTDLVAVYRPREQSPSPRRKGPVFGRTAERACLMERLEALSSGGSSLVLIEGEAGIGKSRLLADLIEQPEIEGVTCLVGAGDAIEKSTSYHAWRPVFSRLLEVEGLTDIEARRAQVLRRLGATPEWLRLAPLLNSILPLDLPENEITAQMSGQVWADNTHDLLLHLLQSAAQQEPIALVLEDAHWLDSASWALTRLVSQRIEPLLLMIATRPLAEPLPPDYRQLLQMPGIQRVRLEALPPEATRALACQRLGVAGLPAPVAALIEEKAQGNPFFSEELAYALRDAGLLRITDGECRITPGVDLGAIAFPDSVQGVITSRIDRLTPSQQLTLKVASVIGRVFAPRVLRDIYPLEPDRAQLPNDLDTLERLDLTSVETPEPDLAYLFKHIITQETAYNLMLYAQRRQLHRAVAEWYERSQAEDPSAAYPLLAYHWSRAEDAAKALYYLEKAGEQALRSGSYQEAVTFLSEALALDAKAKAEPDHSVQLPRRARWERELGAAFMGLGHLDESRNHTQQSLELLGQAVPTTRIQLVRSIFGQVLIQSLHRLWPDRFVARSAEARDSCRQIASAWERIAHIHFYSQDRLMILVSALSALNLAENAGPSPELARGYTMGLAAYTVGLHGLAERYSWLAEKAAERVNDLTAWSWVLMLVGLYTVGVGHWARCRKSLEQAVEIAQRLGDWRTLAESLNLLAILSYHQGELVRASDQFQNVAAVGRQRGNDQAQVWGFCGQAESLLRLGRTDTAVNLLERAAALRGEHIRTAEAIEIHGLRAATHLLRGEPHLARQAADETARLIGQSQPVAVFAFEGYASVVQVYLAEWEAICRKTESERAPAAQRAQRACRALHRYARVFPIAKPRARLYQGQADWLAGRCPRAHKTWKRSIAAAEQLEMPYEQGLAHYELGRHSGADDPARSLHLARACEIFAELGAAYDLKRARDASEGHIGTEGGIAQAIEETRHG